MEGEGKGKKRREEGRKRKVKDSKCEKWEGWEGNQVSGNFIHCISFLTSESQKFVLLTFCNFSL